METCPKMSSAAAGAFSVILPFVEIECSRKWLTVADVVELAVWIPQPP